MTPRTVEFDVRTPAVDSSGRLVQAPLGVARRASEHVAEDFGADHMLINIGPQHPATHGVLRLVVELEGETVRRVIPHIGYLHSGFEKLGEYRQYNQIIPLTDRTDYLAPMANNIALAMAVEALMGIEVTERCRLLRVIAMELSRIISHLVWAGTTGIDLGAFTPFLWMFQERERVYNLQEAWTGARLTTSVARVGGMMADIPEGGEAGLAEFLRTFPATLREVDAMATTLPSPLELQQSQRTAREALRAGLERTPTLAAALCELFVDGEEPEIWLRWDAASGNERRDRAEPRGGARSRRSLPDAALAPDGGGASRGRRRASPRPPRHRRRFLARDQPRAVRVC